MAEENAQGAVNLTGGQDGGSENTSGTEGQEVGAINLTESQGEGGQGEATSTESEGQKGEGQQQSEENKAEEKASVPENYEPFKVPEGFKIEESDNEALVAFAKENKLSQEQAQKVADMGVNFIKRMQETQDNAHKEMVKGWLSEIKSDKELGGNQQNLQETQNRANRALAKYGSAKLVEELTRSGYNSNPELVRLLARVDKATGEDKVPNGDGGSPGGSKLSDADKLYPTMR